MASATIPSATPSLYISAVSISVSPRSSPSLSAAISASRLRALCPRRRLSRALFLLRMELEGENEQEDAEHDGVGADPQGQHHRADQRLDDQKDAEEDRGEAAQREPPAGKI